MFDVIKKLADKQGLSVKDLAIKLGFSENYFYSVKRGVTLPSDKLQVIADYFNVSADYLLGRTEKSYYELNAKDERDIESKMQDILSDLENNALFSKADNSELSEEDSELLIASLENSLRLAKKLAKKKYTPNKYRN